MRLRDVIDQPVDALDELFLRVALGVAASALVLGVMRW